MQMCQSKAFVFVEGFDVDPYFYGQLCKDVFGIAGCTYEIVGAWRLAQTGGKTVLLDFYKYLATTNGLCGIFQAKSFLALFFLDKDIDDVLNSKIVSDHIIYTQYYCVENYLFIHGDILKAAASASSLEERDVAKVLGDPAGWRRSRAELWKDWIIFSILGQKLKIPHQCNYRTGCSSINVPLDSPPDAAAVLKLRQELEADSTVTSEAFQKAYGAVSRLVNSIYARGKHDIVFKGKWYFRFLEKTVESAAAGRAYNSHGISNRLHGAITSTVDFSGEWGQYFKAPMRDILNRVP